MLRLSVLFLVVWVTISGLANVACAADPETHSSDFDAATCTFAASKKECSKAGDCYWCETSPYAQQESVCVDRMQAMHLPSWLYRCTHKNKQQPDMEAYGLDRREWRKSALRHNPFIALPGDGLADSKPIDCSSPLSKAQCLKSELCSWCTNHYSPDGGSRCVETSQARYLPGLMYTCKVGGGREATAPSVSEGATIPGPAPTPGPQPGGQCTSANDKKGCLKQKGCYWCQNKYSPGQADRCMDESQAKFLPADVYKCKKSHKKKNDDDVAEQAAPAQAQPGGDACSRAVDRKECIHQKGCYWCDNKFAPDMTGSWRCVDESQAKFLPDSAFKCSSKKSLPLAQVADPLPRTAANKASTQAKQSGKQSGRANPQASSVDRLKGAVEGMFSFIGKAFSDMFGPSRKKKSPAFSAKPATSTPGHTTGRLTGCTSALDEPSCLRMSRCTWELGFRCVSTSNRHQQNKKRTNEKTDQKKKGKKGLFG